MPHTIHAGKYDPRMLNEGAREHPAISRAPAKDAPVTVIRRTCRPNGERRILIGFSVSFAGIGLWAFRMEQVAGLES